MKQVRLNKLCLNETYSKDRIRTRYTPTRNTHIRENGLINKHSEAVAYVYMKKHNVKLIIIIIIMTFVK
jgi:hypothetical protein